MSELSKALAAVGEVCPEVPQVDWRRGVDAIAPFRANIAVWQELALRLAVRLEEAERCCFCNGTGQMNQPKCPKCGGTGKEQTR